MNDSKKKETWDRYGAAAFDGPQGFDPNAASAGAGPGGGNPFGAGGPFSGFGGGAQTGQGFSGESIFEDLFSAFGGGSANGRRGRRGANQSGFTDEVLLGDSIQTETTISFMEAAKGSSKTVLTNPLVTCTTCAGGGLKSGVKREKCKTCNGTGTRVHFMQGGFQMASTCSSCAGAGQTVPPGSECRACQGNGVVRERKSIVVDIPGGVEDGMRLRISGEGDDAATGAATGQAPGAKSARGDLYVTIRVSPDRQFRREGADVLFKASIPLTTAVLGGRVKVPTLEGEVEVRVATGTGTGDKVVLAGKGMRRLTARRGQMGDLRVEFKVVMPRSLTGVQRRILEVLADEMGDGTARREGGGGGDGEGTGVGAGMGNGTKREGKRGSASAAATEGKAGGGKKDEGFLKSAWHRLQDTLHHHEQQKQGNGTVKGAAEDADMDGSTAGAAKAMAPADEPDEPKKAGGPG